MITLFLDESGDLGFSRLRRNSKFFIVTILSTEERKEIEKIVKKIHRSLRKKVKRLSGGVLHSSKEKPETRLKILKLLADSGSRVMVICIEKDNIPFNLTAKKHQLYNFVTNALLNSILSKKLIKTDDQLLLIAVRL